MSSVGCTAEILSDVDEDPADSLKVKTVGRTRFQVVSMKRQLDGYVRCRVITFLEFLETWKCEGMRLRSVKSQGKVSKSGNSCSQLDKMLFSKLWCELCMNCDVLGHVLRSSYNLPVLYLYRSLIHFLYVMFMENLD